MIVDGKKIAEEMLSEVTEEVNKLPKPPRLAAVLVAAPVRNEADAIGHQISNEARKFLGLKKKAAEKVGIDFRMYEFPHDITTQKLRKEIVKISKAGINQGVIIELPLPSHINTQYILNAVPPEKDPDVLSEKSQGSFFVGRSLVLPPAVEAVRIIFENHDISSRPVRGRSSQDDRSHAFGGAASNGLKGKNCAVFGYGLLVGKPVSHWLASQGATVCVINEFTPDAKRHTLHADIIVSGVGRPNLISADMVKVGAVVIDFGKDVDFEAVSKKAGLITPHIGGVGPIVVAAVLKNLAALQKTKAV